MLSSCCVVLSVSLGCEIMMDFLSVLFYVFPLLSFFSSVVVFVFVFVVLVFVLFFCILSLSLSLSLEIQKERGERKRNEGKRNKIQG